MIFGGAQYDTAWSSGRVATDMGNLGYGVRAAGVSHGFPVQGRPAELPGRGMPRPSGDKDGDAGPFPKTAFPGYRGHFGGGKPPPPTVPPMRHAGPPECTERKVTCHRTVLQGGGAKEAEASGGGAEVEHGEGLRGLRGAAGKCYGV